MNRILIVNPMASAGYLANSLKNLNINVTALQTYSASDVSSFFNSNPETIFDRVVFMQIEEYISSTEPKDFKYILNGADTSVEKTDRLANVFTPQYANSSQTSKIRMNKLLMHQVLADNSLNHIQQIVFNKQTDSLEQISPLVVYPCFVKPLNSAGSVGAKKINDLDGLKQYFAADPTGLCLPNSNKNDFLICEFVNGVEYFVDTFSVNGTHYISSIQKYGKAVVNNIPVFKSSEIETSKEITGKIAKYIRSVLTVLGFSHGFAHSEVFLQANGEPVLIEVNPRISGVQGILNYAADVAGLFTQPELLAHHIYGVPLKVKYQNLSAVKTLFLYNHKNTPLPDLQLKLSKFESIQLVNQLRPVGYVNQDIETLSLVDSVAFIVCYNSEAKKLDQDCREILLQDEIGWN